MNIQNVLLNSNNVNVKLATPSVTDDVIVENSPLALYYTITFHYFIFLDITRALQVILSRTGEEDNYLLSMTDILCVYIQN